MGAEKMLGLSAALKEIANEKGEITLKSLAKAKQKAYEINKLRQRQEVDNDKNKNDSDQRTEKEIVTSWDTHLRSDKEGDVEIWDEDSTFLLKNEELAEIIAFLSTIPVRKK